MRKIEKEEVSVTYEVKKTTAVLLFPNCTYIFCICPKEQVAYDDPEKKIYHLCIVNLVIGYV
jgi:hypothetical protein